MKPCIFALSLVLLGATAMAEPLQPPKVLVSFVVESPIFQEDLVEENGTSRVGDCQTRVAEAMRATLSDPELFPYLNWITTGTGDYTFKATLRDEQGSGDSDTLIVYEGSAGTAIPAHILFGWSESYDREPASLIEIIVARVKADLQGASKAAIENNFAKSVVLVRTVNVRTPDKIVVVPVSGVITNDDSVLRVSLDTSPGYVKLRRALPWTDGLWCRVKEFSLGNIDGQNWDARIPGMIGDGEVLNVRVTMEIFRKRTYANTTDGSVNLPD